MKRTVQLLMIFSLLSAWSVAQQPQQQQEAKPPEGPQPVAEIVQKIIDFGPVPKGEKLKAVFEVKNTGQAPLEISQVRPTCGCTVANFDKTIPPGGTGKINAEVDTSAFLGPISKAILVFTNDPQMRNATVVVKADVKAFIEALPRSLLRFNVLQGEPATDTVLLVASDGATFKVLGVDAPEGPYKVSFRELEGKERQTNYSGSQWEVTVTVPADAKEGMLNHKLTVKTDSPKAPEVPLTVSGLVRPILQVVPGELTFGTVPNDAPVGRNVVIISNRQGFDFKVEKVEIDQPFTTEVVPLQAGQRFQVAVTLPAGTAKGSTLKTTLKITTNDPTRKLIAIPVQATVQ
ncbi:MAG: DUF1573 domain-containing protein [Thermoanaerobaculaceae bacterium]|nr:DUF1573 domain-containing protein [Thermoanaerobaculaceae bacterium]